MTVKRQHYKNLRHLVTKKHHIDKIKRVSGSLNILLLKLKMKSVYMFMKRFIIHRCMILSMRLILNVSNYTNR